MDHLCLVYLGARDATFLRLEKFGCVTHGERAVLQCEFVSADGPYLQVNVSYIPVKGSRTATVLLMIPHHLVLLVMQVSKQKHLAGVAQDMGAEKGTA